MMVVAVFTEKSTFMSLSLFAFAIIGIVKNCHSQIQFAQWCIVPVTTILL